MERCLYGECAESRCSITQIHFYCSGPLGIRWLWERSNSNSQFPIPNFPSPTGWFGHVDGDEFETLNLVKHSLHSPGTLARSRLLFNRGNTSQMVGEINILVHQACKIQQDCVDWVTRISPVWRCNSTATEFIPLHDSNVEQTEVWPSLMHV